MPRAIETQALARIKSAQCSRLGWATECQNFLHLENSSGKAWVY